MGVIGVIGILTLIRVLLWIFGLRRSRQGSTTLNPPLQERNRLGRYKKLQNALSSSYDDDI